MKFLAVFNLLVLGWMGVSCRSQVNEAISNPTEAELSAALEEVRAKVDVTPKEPDVNPNVLGMGLYRYQVEAFLDGTFEPQCKGIAKGEVLKDLGINFQESSECTGSILSWVLDLNRYLPNVADTSPLTIEHSIMPYALNLASISTKDLGNAQVNLVRHVTHGEFEIYKSACPQGFCEKFQKMKHLTTFWQVKKTPKSTDGIQEATYLAAFSRKNGTAVLLKTVFMGTYQIEESALIVPLRITIEIDDMQDVETN